MEACTLSCDGYTVVPARVALAYPTHKRSIDITLHTVGLLYMIKHFNVNFCVSLSKIPAVIPIIIELILYKFSTSNEIMYANTCLTFCSSLEHSHVHMGVTVSIVCMPTLDTRMFALGRVEKHGDTLHYEGAVVAVLHTELEYVYVCMLFLLCGSIKNTAVFKCDCHIKDHCGVVSN